MQMSLILTLVVIPLTLAVAAAIVYLIILLIKALRKYLRSGEVRQENREAVESLAKALKSHRERCRMTQEFVAETIGVSRQAVSKWETGAADPSTANLLALAKLYGVSAEELLRGTRGGRGIISKNHLFPGGSISAMQNTPPEGAKPHSGGTLSALWHQKALRAFAALVRLVLKDANRLFAVFSAGIEPHPGF